MIPVYKELDNCRIVLPELQSVLRSMDISFHIVFVVAGDDGTRAYIDELGDETVSYVYE